MELENKYATSFFEESDCVTNKDGKKDEYKNANIPRSRNLSKMVTSKWSGICKSGKFLWYFKPPKKTFPVNQPCTVANKYEKGSSNW